MDQAGAMEKLLGRKVQSFKLLGVYFLREVPE